MFCYLILFKEFDSSALFFICRKREYFILFFSISDFYLIPLFFATNQIDLKEMDLMIASRKTQTGFFGNVFSFQ